MPESTNTQLHCLGLCPVISAVSWLGAVRDADLTGLHRNPMRDDQKPVCPVMMSELWTVPVALSKTEPQNQPPTQQAITHATVSTVFLFLFVFLPSFICFCSPRFFCTGASDPNAYLNGRISDLSQSSQLNVCLMIYLFVCLFLRCRTVIKQAITQLIFFR